MRNMSEIKNDATILALENKIKNSLDFPEKDAILEIVKLIRDNDTRRRRVMGLVQEALGQLRMDMKYLMFDLEATRRERDKLRDKK